MESLKNMFSNKNLIILLLIFFITGILFFDVRKMMNDYFLVPKIDDKKTKVDDKKEKSCENFINTSPYNNDIEVEPSSCDISIQKPISASKHNWDLVGNVID